MVNELALINNLTSKSQILLH